MAQITRFSTTVGLLGLCLLAGVARGADEVTIQVGDSAPEFQCRDDQGNLWNSRDSIGKKTVIIYFYQSDFSFCCTRQAQRYRDHLCELEYLQAEVVGISGDSVAAHQKFAAVHQLSFPLLSDGTGAVARQFGVPLRGGGKAIAKDADDASFLDHFGQPVTFPRNVTASRWTFIIDQNGRVIYRETEVSPIGDAQKVVDFLCQRARDRRTGAP